MFTYVPPTVVAFTVTFTVITHAAAPEANEARLHVTAFPTFPHAPVGEVTLVTVYCDGTVSDTTTFDAFDGPALFTVSV